MVTGLSMSVRPPTKHTIELVGGPFDGVLIYRSGSLPVTLVRDTNQFRHHYDLEREVNVGHRHQRAWYRHEKPLRHDQHHHANQQL